MICCIDSRAYFLGCNIIDVPIGIDAEDARNKFVHDAWGKQI